MNNLQNNFINAINFFYVAYNQPGGARSNTKLIPIHKFLSETILKKLKSGYAIKSLGIGDNKEAKVEGKYYPKRLDITIFKEDKIVATVSFKFVTSNYKQNVNNYFEQLMGETANIRRQNIAFAHFLVLQGHTPYYFKNKGNLRGEEKKREIISEKNLQKYIKLFNDMDFPHRPDLIGICLLDFDQNKKARFINLDDFNFSSETKQLLKSEFSLNKFLDKFVHLVNLKS